MRRHCDGRSIGCFEAGVMRYDGEMSRKNRCFSHPDAMPLVAYDNEDDSNVS